MTDITTESRPYITSSGRDLRLDFLRGYFILIMIIDHIAGPSPLYWFTGGIQFFVSGAEGFFLISGLVTGIVYHRIIESHGLGAALQKMLHRLLVLYLVATSLKLIMLMMSDTLWAGNQPQPQEIIRIIFLKSGGVITAYVFLFILAPLALILLNNGKGKYLLAVSWIWYILYVFFPDSAAFPYITFTNISGLQVLFFTAMYIGFKKYNTLDYGQKLLSKKWLVLFASSFLILIVFYILLHPLSWMPQNVFPQGTTKWLDRHLFDNATLRPGRLVAGMAVYGTFFIFLSLYWNKLSKTAGWFIMPFGVSALYAFSVHIPVDSALNILISGGYIQSTFVSNMVIQIFAVLLIWFLTAKKVLAPTKQTMRYWYFFSPVLAVLLLISNFAIHSPILSSYLLRALVYWLSWFPAGPLGL